MHQHKILIGISLATLLCCIGCGGSTKENTAASSAQEPEAAPQVYDFTPVDINPLSDVSSTFLTPRMSTNMLPGTMGHLDNYLTDGKLRMVARGGRRPSKSLRVKGYYQDQGTMIVQVDVSQLALAIEDTFGRDQKIALRDAEGWSYSPFGYWLREGVEVEIGLDRRNYFRTLRELPPLPSSGENQLILLFRPTIDAHITGMTVGDTVVGTANYWASERK